MAKITSVWSVSIPWHASFSVEVEATTRGEAIEKALSDHYPALCHQCTSGGVELGEMNEECEVHASRIGDVHDE